MRILVVGASTQPVCGVRDYEHALHDSLARGGVETTTVWWDRRSAERTHAFASRAEAELARTRCDAVVWNYSVFAYGTRGIPFGVAGLAWRLSRNAPLVVVLHELAYDLGRRGLRGTIQAVTQRLALAAVLRRASAVIVTTEERATYVLTRRWLPRRTVRFVPVPSNVTPVAREAAASPGFDVGVFGFRGERTEAEIVARAVAALEGARLVLVGAPGPASPQGERWRRAAEEARCELSFTGVLDHDGLSAAIAGLDAVVFPSSGGPSPRRGTLAAALAHGRPVVAIDGPWRWDRLADEGAVLLADPDTLAGQRRVLAEDEHRRRNQGERGRRFYERTMAPDVVAAQLTGLLRELA